MLDFLSNYSGWVSEALVGGHSAWLPLIVFMAALADSINPCAISVLLITVAFLFSLQKNRRQILAIGGVFILGIFLTYLIIGLGLIRVLQLFGQPHLVTAIGAWILIVWSLLNLADTLLPWWPIKLKIPQGAHNRIAKLIEKSAGPAALFLGILVGLTEFPCTGGPYLFILGLLQNGQTFLSGALYLFFYNVVFVLPLIIILLLASKKALLDKVKTWKAKNTKGAEVVTSIILIGLGVAILVL